MKKIILNSIAILGFTFIAISQDSVAIKIMSISPTTSTSSDLNTDYSSDHSPFIINVSTLGIYNVTMQIDNNSTIDKSWRMKRFVDINTPASWTSHFIFNSNCYAISNQNPWCSPDNMNSYLNILSNQSNTISFEIGVNSYETGNYKIYVGDCATDEDSISIQINCVEAGILENNKLKYFSIYPNPSDDQISINLFSVEKRTFTITDLFGNVLYSEKNNLPSKIDVSDFKNGIYFVSIESDGVKLSTRKLVVKHL